MQGSIASTISLTAIFGPPLMTCIFGAYVDNEVLNFPGAPFFVSAVLMVVAVASLAVTFKRHVPA